MPSHRCLTHSQPAHWNRGLNAEFTNSVINQSRIRATAKQILATIQLDEDGNNQLFKSQDVYNLQALHRMEILGLLTLIQALMQEFYHRLDWFMRYTADDSDRVIRLFFARNSSYRILTELRGFVSRLHIQINPFLMPLCVITGVTSLNTTYNWLFVF